MDKSKFHTYRVGDKRFVKDHLYPVVLWSNRLRRRASLNVYIPPHASGPLPIVVLLHGVYGDANSWPMGAGAHLQLHKAIELRQINPMILVFPSDGLFGDGSAYLPLHHGDYDGWIRYEVIEAVYEATPLATPVSSVYIGGLSMGGYGALRLGCKYADFYSGIAAHSPITRLDQMALFVKEDLINYATEDPQEGEILYWAQKNLSQLPPIRIDCGKDDELLAAANVCFTALKQKSPNVKFEVFPGGHEWPYWEKYVMKTLTFFNQIETNQ